MPESDRQIANPQALGGGEADERAWWPRLLLPVLIALIAFVAFWPTLGNVFVDWDDEVYLLDNPDYRGLGWANLKWMFTTRHGGHYQPISWLTWGLDYVAWEMNPKGYHLTSMLFHAANAAIFYLVAVSVLRVARSEGDRPVGLPIRVGACAAALLFAVHPLRVESVSWATERRDVVSGLFYLLTILACLRWYRRAPKQADGRPSGWPLGALVLFVLAMLSKSMSVSLPVVLLILDVYPLRRIRLARTEPDRHRFGPQSRRALLEKIPFFAAAVGIGVITWIGQTDVGAMTSLEKLSIIERPVFACYGVLFYLRKTIFPTGLSPLYEFPFDRDILYWPFLLSTATFVLICVAAYRSRRRVPALPAAWVGYLVILAPVCGLVHSGPQLVADRYSYLPMLSIALLIGGGVCHAWARWGVRARRLGVAVAALVVVALGVSTWKQCQAWRDAISLWERVLEVDPDSWHAHNNLGIRLAALGRTDEAMTHYQEAIDAKPGFGNAHHNLGILLEQLGRMDEAELHFQAALAVDPNYSKAYMGLGEIHLRREEPALAVEQYYKALELEPDHAPTLSNLGHALTLLDRSEEAIPKLRRAVELAPKVLETNYNLAVALERAGKLDQAIAQYRRCTELDRDHLKSAENLGALLVGLGRFDEAVEPLRTVARLRVDDVPALTNLGMALEKARRYHESWEVLTRAHRKAPQDLPTAFALAWLQATSPVDEVRDGAAAAESALRICAAKFFRDARSLDLLACAYAEIGRFQEAVDTARQAAHLARAAGKTARAQQIDVRLSLFKAGKPYRQPAAREP